MTKPIGLRARTKTGKIKNNGDSTSPIDKELLKLVKDILVKLKLKVQLYIYRKMSWRDTYKNLRNFLIIL